MKEPVTSEGDLLQMWKAPKERWLEYNTPFSDPEIYVLATQSGTRLYVQLFSHWFLVFCYSSNYILNSLRADILKNSSLSPLEEAK